MILIYVFGAWLNAEKITYLSEFTDTNSKTSATAHFSGGSDMHSSITFYDRGKNELAEEINNRSRLGM
jgi:hypothetical protein